MKFENFTQKFSLFVSSLVFILGILIFFEIVIPNFLFSKYQPVLAIVFMLYGVYRFVTIYLKIKEKKNIDENISEN